MEDGEMKEILCAVTGLIGSGVASIFAGWSSGMTTLILCMAVDYISGMLVAGVFHRSKKTDTGALKSSAGFKGLCRKGMTLLIVLIAYRLDLILGTNYIRNVVIIAFITNEMLSIVENAGLMGIPMPTVITRAIDLLQRKSGGKEEDSDEKGA
jgi:toxin secretion/phage lysis holin